MINQISKRIINNKFINPIPSLAKSKFIYSTTNFERPLTSSNRTPPSSRKQLKAYQKLFHSPPIMNINIQMIMTINQLRPKATYIIATKNGQHPKQISNSTHNIIECLKFIKGYKFYFKSFPSLIENILKVMNEGIDFSLTGIYKTNTIKKLIQNIVQIDSIYGEDLVELICVYLIRVIQSSIKVRKNMNKQIVPLRNKLQQLKYKLDDSSVNNNQKQNEQKIDHILTQQQKISLKKQISSTQYEINKVLYQNQYLKQQDFLCALHYCLQKGYYNDTILQQFLLIMQRDNYTFPDYEYFVNQQKSNYLQKPLSNIQNKMSHIYCRMFNNICYRIKILYQIKKIKLYDIKFMDSLFKHKKKQSEQDTSQQTSQQSPFIDGQKLQENQSQSTSSDDKKIDKQFINQKLIQQSIISKTQYLQLINNYLDLFERKDILCYILTDQTMSQGLRSMPTQFFSYLEDQQLQATPLKKIGKKSNINLIKLKSRYLSIFKQIFDIENNGQLYAQSLSLQTIFEIILKLYSFEDRKQIYNFLKIHERYLLSKPIDSVKSITPFYVYEKYHYRSNFIASKLLDNINSKNKLLVKQQHSTKQEMILQSFQICNYLSLYFKILQNNVQESLEIIQKNGSNSNNFSKNVNRKSLFSQDLNNQTSVYFQKLNQSEQIMTMKNQKQFKNAEQLFMSNYNKLISVIYLEKDNNLGIFVGKGLQLTIQMYKTKVLRQRYPDKNSPGSGGQTISFSKTTQQDIKKIMSQYSQTVKFNRKQGKQVINIYQKSIKIKQNQKNLNNNSQSHSKDNSSNKSGSNQTNILYKFDPFYQTIFSRKNYITNPMDQISCIFDIMQTAIRIQNFKQIQFYEDSFVIFKNIFQNKKLLSLITTHQMYPSIFRQLIRISQYFKGSYKNQSNKLFQYILSLTNFNLNTYLHSIRIKIAKQIINSQKIFKTQQKYQPYLQFLSSHIKYTQNLKIWPDSQYNLNTENILNNIRSDILYAALEQNNELQKIMRQELAKIKTIRPSQKIKSMKFQLNYLQYPYYANIAVSKNNELIVLLVRKNHNQSKTIGSNNLLINTQQMDRQKTAFNNALNDYYKQCQQYFNKKGSKVIIIGNQMEIRMSLRELIK